MAYKMIRPRDGKPSRETLAESQPAETPTSPLDGAATDNAVDADARNAEIADFVAGLDETQVAYLRTCLDKRDRGDIADTADDPEMEMSRMERDEYAATRPATKNS